MLEVGLAALGVATAFAVPAAAAPRVVDLPGSDARSVAVAGAARLGDGGAIVALARDGSAHAARLRHDGTVRASYGRGGLARAARGRAPVAVAAEPDGRAVLALAGRPGGPGSLVALDASGARRWSVGLPAALAGGPVAVALGGGRIAVAGGVTPCRGCAVALLDAATGALLAETTVAPVAGNDPAACPGARVAAVALVGEEILAAGRGVAGAAGCEPALGRRVPGAEHRSVALPGPALLATDGEELCVASRSGDRVQLARGPADSLRPLGEAAAGAGLSALTALPAGGCAALLAGRRGGGWVIQSSGGAPHVDALPPGLRARALFRCDRHLLAVGTRRHFGARRIAAVGVLRVR